MKLEQIETPALIIDESIYEKNIAAMRSLLAGKSLKLRPHYKSHKCAAIACRQIRDGAVGMTCAKLSEAEDLADAGIEDILIANQITDPEKIMKLAYLAKKCKLTVCIDSEENVRALSRAASCADSTIHCYVEYEIGMCRCGVAEQKEVIALARAIRDAEHLVFSGIQAYAGHISHEEDTALRAEAVAKNGARLRALLKALRDEGLEVQALSGGSTGTATLKAEEGLYTELQAGSYLFMDATYRHLDAPFENALFVLSSVISVKDGRTVVDAGVKTCGVDQGLPVPKGFTVGSVGANEEHFVLSEPSVKHAVGDKVLLIPGHCCSTVNLFDKIYFVKDGKVTGRVAVSARGKSK